MGTTLWDLGVDRGLGSLIVIPGCGRIERDITGGIFPPSGRKNLHHFLCGFCLRFGEGRT